MRLQDANIKRERLQAFFCDLVDIYSPTGKEHEAVEFTAEFLHHHQLPVELQHVSDERCNIAVVPGDPKQIKVAYMGHLDTVPAYDLEQQTTASLHNGMVQGLGTADMKSGCAALVEAFVASAQTGQLPDNAALFLVVGEEETGDGTEAILENWSFPHALIAEPTDLLPCLSHHGYLEVMTRTYGLRRHASQSGPETNATLSMLHVLHEFTAHLKQYDTSIIMNIRDLHSSESGFAVPDRCEAWIDLHMPPYVPMEKLISSVQEHLNQQFESGKASYFDLEFTTQAPGFEIDSTGVLPTLLHRLFVQHDRPWRPISFASHSDACLLHEAGCAPLMLGPGQLAQAHTRDEAVPLEQVMQASDLFLEMLRLQQSHDFTD